MKLPLPRSRKARLLVAVVVLAAGGGAGGVTLLGGSEPAAADAAAAAAETGDIAEEAGEPAGAPSFLLTVDPAALPEATAPADAPVVEPEGPDGMLSLAQLAELEGVVVTRDGTGRLRTTSADWRGSATVLDDVAALPGVVSVEPADDDTFLVTTELTAEQLAVLPGVVTVTHPDGSAVATATDEADAPEEAVTEAGH